MGKTAIEAKRGNVFFVDANDVILVDNPDHPLYDDRLELPLDENMVKNVAKLGVHTPIDVKKEVLDSKAEGYVCPTKNGKHHPGGEVLKDGEEYLLVVKGRQRVRWARAANVMLEKAGSPRVMVPTLVRKGTEGEMYAITSSENSVRVEESVMSKARKVQHYMGLDGGHTKTEASVVFGVTEQAVSQWLDCLNLAPKIQKAVDDGKLSPSAAGKLGKLPQEEQIAKFDEMVEKGIKPTVRNVEATAHSKGGGAQAARPSKHRVTKMIEELLTKNNKSAKSIALGMAWVLGTCSEEGFRDDSDVLACVEEAFQVIDDKKGK